MKRETEREAISIDETAEKIGASPKAVRKWISEGELPHVRIGRRIFIPLAGLRERLESWRPQTKLSREAKEQSSEKS